MNYDSVTINLKKNKSLSWHTIERSITKQGKYLRQSCCQGMFAKITLKIEPHRDKQVAIFENKITEINYGRLAIPLKESEIQDDLQMIFSGVILGIESACLTLKSKSFAIIGIKVTALKAVVHPVESHSKAFERATKLTLLEAFNEVELIEI